MNQQIILYKIFIQILKFYKGIIRFNSHIITDYFNMSKTDIKQHDFVRDLSVLIPVVNQSSPPFPESDAQGININMQNLLEIKIYQILIIK